MQVTYLISIQAQTLMEATLKIYPCGGEPCLGGHIVGHPSVIISGGPGTELKNLIAKFGLKPGLNCKCGQHIREMDIKGIEWCTENIPTITGWLHEEAQRAKLPFTEIGAKLLIRKAIRNASKKQQGEQDMRVNYIITIDEDDGFIAMEKTRPKEGKVIAGSFEPDKLTPQPQGTTAKKPV